MGEITASVLMKWSGIGTGIGLGILLMGLLLIAIAKNLKWKRLDADNIGMAISATGACASAMCFLVFLITLLWRILESLL